MKQAIMIIVFCLALSVSLTAQSGLTIEQGKPAIPLAFTENRGQVHSSVLFYAKTPAYNIGVTKQGLMFNDGSQLRFLGANPDVVVEPAGKRASKANFFRGNDPKGWITGANAYPAVLYREIYRGVDLKIYGNDRHIEYDWILKPNADPKQIRFVYKHVKEAELDSNGDLQITTSQNRLLHRRPIAYQIIDGQKKTIKASFKPLKRNLFGFKLGPYDTERQLVIDPLITRFATYLGGTGTQDYNYSMAVDNFGYIYICGSTDSYDFPVQSPIQNQKSHGKDGFVCKIDPENSLLLFSTYIGGNRDDWNYRMTLGPNNAIYVCGVTYSTNFPLQNPFQSYNAGDADAFVFKLSSSGDRLLYSTYLGGWYYDSAKGIHVDGNEFIYLTGLAWFDFPLKKPIMEYSSGGDNYICKLTADGQSLVYSTYVGGDNYDSGTQITVDAQGSPVALGITRSPNYPTAKGWQTTFGGIRDTFITKLDKNGTSIEFSTLIGGAGDDYSYSMVQSQEGRYYILGHTESENFPVKNAWQQSLNGVGDAFLIDVDLVERKLVFATYFGGSGNEYGRDMVIRPGGELYFIGQTNSTDLPMKNPVQRSNGGGFDLFISKFDAQATELQFSTYLGRGNDETVSYNGIGQGPGNNLYIACSSNSTDMEVMNPIQGMNRGGFDVYVAKLALDEAPSVEIVKPEEGDIVAGLVEIGIEAEDDVGVTMVNVYIDDELQHTDRDAPYSFDWDSSLVANGPHRVKAEAIDTMGFASTHQIEIQVQNAAITLNAQRTDDRGWLVRKTCGVLEFTVQKPEGLPITSYAVYRRELNGHFQKIADIPDSNPNLLIQNHQFIDTTIPADRTCWYCVHAISDTGETFGLSNTCTL